MKLYYYPGACSLADHIALIEAGLPCTLLSIDATKTTEDGRDFLIINPKGYIPALELDDGTVLTENPVILAYIAAQSGTLLPQDDLLKWKVSEALAYMSSEVHGAYAPFFRKRPEAETAQGKEKVIKALALLSKQMSDKPFLIGEEITIADCYLFWVIRAAPIAGVDVPENLQNWFARMMSRPTVLQALKEEGLS